MTLRQGIAIDPPNHPGASARAARLAANLGLPIDPTADLLLQVRPDRLQLHVQRGEPILQRARPTAVDLTALDTTSGPGRSLHNPLLRAVGRRKGQAPHLRIIDATAGFGADTWLLAAAGCTVTAIERHPLLHTLLDDALHRAAATSPQTAGRITLIHGDAGDLLPRLTADDDLRQTIIYLDPMFPAARRAAQQKTMRLARLLTGEQADHGATLLATALATGHHRIVVKRPRKAPPLPGPTPITTHPGRAHRFDIYHGRIQ